MNNPLIPNLIPIGKLLKPKGLNGELRVTIFNETDSSLKIGKTIWFKNDESNYSRYTIEKIILDGNKSCIKFYKCINRQDAEKIQGMVFFLYRKEFDPIKEGQHYLVDLLGVEVFDENENNIGIVRDVLTTNKQNIIEVNLDNDKILIPYVEYYVTLFDKIKKILFVKNISELIN